MTPPFGLPSNYTGNAMYQQYMMMMLQAAQQQQRQAAMQQQEMQNLMQLKQSQQAQQDHYAQMDSQIAASTPKDIPAAQQVAAPKQIGDGKDDGKISFGSKLKNFGKGVGKFFTGMVCDDSGNFSWKRTLTTAAVAAGAVALCVATGGAAAPFLVAAGAAMGGLQVGKGVYHAATAKTDSESEKAWQDIGSGTTAIAGSLAGAKGALKSAGKVDVSGYKGISGAFKATGKAFTESGRMTKAGYNNLKTDFTGTLTNAKDVGWSNLSAKFNNNNAAGYFQEKALGKFDKQIAKLEKKIGKLDPAKDAKELTKLNSELSIQKANKQQLTNQMAAMEAKTPLEYQTVIDKSKADLVRYKEALADIKENSGSRWNRTPSEKALIQQHKSVIKHIENEIKTLEQYQKVSSAGYKKANAETINDNKKLVENYEKDIKDFKSQLKKETDTNVQQQLKTQIDNLQTSIDNFKAKNITEGIGIKENYEFAKAKFITPGMNELKTNRLWMNTAAVNNGVLPSIQIAPDAISEQDAYAQANGFQSAQQMMEYIQAMQGSQSAINQADQVLASNSAGQYNTNQSATNPYGSNNMFSNYNMQMPQGNELGFNDLYQSPYPDMI